MTKIKVVFTFLTLAATLGVWAIYWGPLAGPKKEHTRGVWVHAEYNRYRFDNIDIKITVNGALRHQETVGGLEYHRHVPLSKGQVLAFSVIQFQLYASCWITDGGVVVAPRKETRLSGTLTCSYTKG